MVSVWLVILADWQPTGKLHILSHQNRHKRAFVFFLSVNVICILKI